jgi:hypothetical protein
MYFRKNYKFIKITNFSYIMENDLILYYAPTPNGWKITILLEEANIDYKLVLINIAAGD